MADKKLTSYPKNKINILFLENISTTSTEIFNAGGYMNVKILSGALSEAELIKEIKNVHLLGVRSKTMVTRKVFDAAPKLQAIGCFCIGVNQVDMEAAIQHGVAVFNAPYSNTRSVAELVIGASIFLVRRIIDKNIAAHEGVWMKDAGGAHELRGKSIGIIGYGNIGSQVSVLAEALGMKVLFYDVETKLPLGNASDSKSLKELIRNSDIVTLHVPQLPTTKNLINKQNLTWFKKGAILINYARGTVVDLDALKAALDAGQLGGAAIDVFPNEPEHNGDRFVCQLQHLKNVLLTPHIGGSTIEAQSNIGQNVSAKLFNYLEKGVSTGSHSVPALALPPQENAHRILHIHKNIPGVLSEVNTLLSKNKINILGQYLKTNDAIGYVVLDINKNLGKSVVDLLKDVKGTIRVRMLY
ncbi:MAG: phosphoglycerate dehydrogenase [Ferruginibacter sp.]|nr:phosphoglycerate dehydrogenase [Ferruginibacter sp.]